MSFWRSNRYTNSISHQLLAGILIVSSIVTSVLTGLQLRFEYVEDVSAVEKNLSLVQAGYSKGVASSLWEMHYPQVQFQLEGILSIPGIQYVRVMDGDKMLAQAGSFPTGRSISRIVNLSHTNKGLELPIGKMEVYADIDQVLQKLYKKVLMVFITQFLKTLIVSFLIYLLMQRLLTRHLVRISDYLKDVRFESARPDLSLNRKDKSLRIGMESEKDELDVLVESINEMQNQIRHSYRELNQVNQNLEEIVAEKTDLIIQQRQKLEYSSKMSFLGEMAGGIAHEINTPLSTMTVNLELLLNALDKTELQKDVFRKILKVNQLTVERIAKIIQGLRTFSRDGSLDPFTPTLVKTLILGATSLCLEKFKNADVDLRVSRLPDDVLISCRSTEIRQVLLNLLNNAFDAIRKLEHKWIQIDFESTETEDRIIVTDSGAGLSNEVQQKMFQPFFSTKEIGQGTGLGLSVSQGIIENHGGILVYDKSHTHTRFIIILPKSSVAQQAV